NQSAADSKFRLQIRRGIQIPGKQTAKGRLRQLQPVEQLRRKWVHGVSEIESTIGIKLIRGKSQPAGERRANVGGGEREVVPIRRAVASRHHQIATEQSHRAKRWRGAAYDADDAGGVELADVPGQVTGKRRQANWVERTCVA